MNRTAILEQIQKNVERLSAPDLPEYKYIPLHQKPSPSVATLHEIMRLLRTVIFPGFFGTEQEAQLGSIQYYTGVYLEKIYDLLQEQIYNGLCFEVERCCDSKDRASEISIVLLTGFLISNILLSTDVRPSWMVIRSQERGVRLYSVIRRSTRFYINGSLMNYSS